MDTSLFQVLASLARLFFRETTINEILRVDLDGEQELVILDFLVDTSQDFEQDASTVLE